MIFDYREVRFKQKLQKAVQSWNEPMPGGCTIEILGGGLGMGYLLLGKVLLHTNGTL